MAGHSVRGWMPYTPSAFGGALMALKCDPFTAANNSVAFTTSPAVQSFWPFHRADLRAVYGKDSTKVTDSCIASAPSGTLFTLGATFTDAYGNSYTVVGLKTERYRVRNLK